MTDAFGGEASAMTEAPAPDAIVGTAHEADTVEQPSQATKPEPAQKPSNTIREAVQKARDSFNRDEVGRFAPKTGEQPLQTAQKPMDGQQTPEAPKPAIATDAPSRFTPDARAAWASTPEPVKAEVSRAFRELETGLQQYQQRFEPMKPYFQMAEQAGTSVHEALERYTQLERSLAADDPTPAIMEIFRYAGVNPREWAARIAGQPVNQSAAAYENTITQLMQKISGLEQQFGSVNQHIQSQQEREVLNQIESFKASKPRFDELQPTIVRLIETGFAGTLEDAYEHAEKLNPSPVQTPTLQPQPLKRTQSISGAPPAGSNPAYRKPSSSIRESIERAKSQMI